MAETALAGKSERLISLDTFRGLTIAGMVLVNNPGTWGAMYPPLGHAQWDGWTPTDFIFPFFLFIVGVAMTFSFDRRMQKGQSRVRLFEQVVRRTLILFLLGLTMYGFPNFRLIGPFILFIAGLGFLYSNEPIMSMGGDDPKARRNKITAIVVLAIAVLWWLIDIGHFLGPNDWSSWRNLFPLGEVDKSHLRIPGVLQRIAVCYFFASMIMLFTGWRGRLLWGLLLINVYWLLMKYVSPPGDFVIGAVDGASRGAPADAPYPGALNAWLDWKLLGSHLYSQRPDPEGILSSMPAIATVLAGVLTGSFLKSDRTKLDKAVYMAIAGNALIILGACMDYYFPINKKIWSSSYVVFTAGWGVLILALCYYLLDVKKQQWWSKPFMILGTNAIFVFFASTIMAVILAMTQVPGADGTSISLKGWIYGNLYKSWIGSERLSSAAFAVSYVILWICLTYPLFRKRLFLKI